MIPLYLMSKIIEILMKFDWEAIRLKHQQKNYLKREKDFNWKIWTNQVNL